MPLTRKQMPSPNYSSRGGASVRLIVLHTAEGATTIESLGNFFANPNNDVSSHTGADDKLNLVGEYVKRGNKAWTAANANPVAVQIELCAFAAWTTDEWHRHPNMLQNCAQWIKEESDYFGIPIVRLNASQAQGSGRGVCQHADLGSWGGGHWDCGSGFPMNEVLEMAKGGGEVTSLPEWWWDWALWYYTSNRDSDERPGNAPATIPEWAWDEGAELEKLLKRYGMTSVERDWIVWNLGGKVGPRPPAPDPIYDFWWNDRNWAEQQGVG